MTEDETVYAAAEDEPQVVDGRCHYLTTGGKRCPNAALSGSLYCGIPSHQAADGERT